LFAQDLFGKPLHTFPDHALKHDEIRFDSLNFPGSWRILVV
jgi:hypothetical protein